MDASDGHPTEVIRVAGPDHEPLLDRFWSGIYLDAFAGQREPLAVWKQRLWGGHAPYRLDIHVAGADLVAGGPIDGGIVFEHYPGSNCALITYLVVAPGARRRGLGRRLLAGAVADAHAAVAAARRPGLVLGEVIDPRRAPPGAAAAARARLARFERWGARALEVDYVQPALGPGLTRARDLCLIAFPGPGGLGAAADGAVVAGLVRELFAITEGAGRDADPELIALLAGIGAVIGWRPPA